MDDLISRHASFENHGEIKSYSKDTIYRQDALDALGEEPLLWEAEDDYTLGQLTEWRRYKKALEALPSAQPDWKKGKWIERNPLDSDKCRLIECSECGRSAIVPFNVPYEHWIHNRNFCERCGADMRQKGADHAD